MEAEYNFSDQWFCYYMRTFLIKVYLKEQTLTEMK